MIPFGRYTGSMNRMNLLLLGALTIICAGCDRFTGEGDRAAAGTGLLAGDASPADPPSVRHDLAAAPEAMSLLGEPLYRPLPDSAAEVRMRAQLDSAVSAHEARPDDADAAIWLGRRLGYMGYYREAIRAFSDGIRAHPDDPRLYRHRGHRYISVRELDRAIEDLEHAARLISGRDDAIEPDGQPNAAGVPRSTLHTNIWYHLGLARYVEGDFTRAAHAFRRGLDISPNDDMRVAMADWLWLSLTRLDRTGQADALLEEVLTDSMEILENDAYRQRLRLYRGDLPADSLLPPDPDALAVATYGYGLGTWHLVRGDTVAARAIYEDLSATGYWPAFGYLAAEAELARLKDQD